MTTLPQIPAPGTYQQALPVNEVYGPTLQGEGPMTGTPCFFIRVQNCPVQCPGCDTHYTWDGTETGERLTAPQLFERLAPLLKEHPQVKHVVISGGEPLIYYRNAALNTVLARLVKAGYTLALETSGWFHASPTKAFESHLAFGDFCEFIRRFRSISISPKVTGALRGQLPDEQTAACVQTILAQAETGTSFFKFVVRGEEDTKEIFPFLNRLHLRHPVLVYLMPFGQTSVEVMQATLDLIPVACKYGLTISTRLQSLLWGKCRGV